MQILTELHINDYRQDQARIVEAAEHLLSTETPKGHNPYFERTQVPGTEPTLRPGPVADFSYFWLCCGGAEDDDEATNQNPHFQEEAVLGAIVEVLRFCERNLCYPESNRWRNVYFSNDLVNLCRRHLIQLLGRWYELQNTAAA